MSTLPPEVQVRVATKAALYCELLIACGADLNRPGIAATILDHLDGLIALEQEEVLTVQKDALDSAHANATRAVVDATRSSYRVGYDDGWIAGVQRVVSVVSANMQIAKESLRAQPDATLTAFEFLERALTLIPGALGVTPERIAEQNRLLEQHHQRVLAESEDTTVH